LHVNPPTNPITPPESEWINQEEISQELEQQLEQSGVELRSEGFRADDVSRIGAIQKEILAVAEEQRVDLLVMGTHGRSGLERFLFGSYAESVSRHVSCPLLVIGPEVPLSSAQVWSPRQIICATSLNPDSAWRVEFAYMLAQEYRAELLLCSVEGPTHRKTQEQWYRFENALKKSLPEGALSNISSVALRFEGEPGLEIADLAKDRSSDLIIIGAHHASVIAPHLPRGTVPLVFSMARCPVMTFHSL
jgi:nucleotide-binding universal stress UspA family protein